MVLPKEGGASAPIVPLVPAPGCRIVSQRPLDRLILLKQFYYVYFYFQICFFRNILIFNSALNRTFFPLKRIKNE
jgi:hypothetical protein